jgi:REP element-mobilizing transposase RayT
MAKTVGYMITWTTYGTWLQGGEKGFVKDGKVRGENIAIKKDCEKKLEGKPVRLGRREKSVVREAILEAAKRFRQKICAIAVYSNHVHIVAEYVGAPISVLVSYYKSAGRVALKEYGFKGKVWTKGFDKRFCFNEEDLSTKVDYVNRHGKR